MPTVELPIAGFQEGDAHAVKVGQVNVLVCLIEGQFYAVHALCSHAGQSLATGRLRGYEISCPLHGARFDVRSGACTRAPATAPIKRFPVLLERGKVCIEVS